MKRFRWKSGVWVLMLMLILSVAELAGAETPQRLKTCYSFSGIAANGDETEGADLAGTSTAVTCREYTWSVVNSKEGRGYELAMTIGDGSYADPDVYDTLYVRPRETGEAGNQMTYLFYEPGNYCLFAQVFDVDETGSWTARLDAYGNEIYLTHFITVTDGSGTNALTEAVQIAAAACRRTDDYETAVAINDYLCERAEYDDGYEYYSAEGILLHGRAVCNGYSRAFHLIAKELGLGCRRITGKAGTENHAWNAVMMDGEWYLVDATWNDTGGGGHAYFGLTDELMAIDHTVGKVVGGSITCTALRDNYYIRSGAWEILAKDILSETQKAVDGRNHSFSVELGDWVYDEFGNRVYDAREMIVTAKIVEYAYKNGLKIWKCTSTGEVFLISGAECVFDELDNPAAVTGQMMPEKRAGTLTLPAKLKKISSEAFAGETAYTIVISDGCTAIGARAFTGGRIWEIVIPESVVTIDEAAFEGTSGVLIRTPQGSAAAEFAAAHDLELIEE